MPRAFFRMGDNVQCSPWPDLSTSLSVGTKDSKKQKTSVTHVSRHGYYTVWGVHGFIPMPVLLISGANGLLEEKSSIMGEVQFLCQIEKLLALSELAYGGPAGSPPLLLRNKFSAVFPSSDVHKQRPTITFGFIHCLICSLPRTYRGENRTLSDVRGSPMG